MEIQIEHHTYAHCENGVISTLLRHHGMELSEPMVFGLASGLFFAHMPFLKMSGMAVTAFRTFPGVLFKRICKILGVKGETSRFLNKKHAMAKLDTNLKNGIPTACVVGMYYLSYMPFEYRFHFNGHNICVCGKDETTDEYLISDPIATIKTTLSAKDLQRARFAKGGTYPILGQMYWIKSMPKQTPDLAPLIKKAIRKNCYHMVGYPKWVYFGGVNGIYFLAKRIKNWEKEMGVKPARLNLAHIVRMSEEIGTGGAGFRFMYGAFLQEAAEITGIKELKEFSFRITEIGDLWREFAMMASRIFKKRQTVEYTYNDLSEILFKIARLEEQFFKDLRKLV